MDEIKLPQHVVNRIERRWTARFAQAEDWQRPERTPCYRPQKLRSSSIAASSAADGGIPEAADFLGHWGRT
jgi:hypothetical protein